MQHESQAATESIYVIPELYATQIRSNLRQLLNLEQALIRQQGKLTAMVEMVVAIERLGDGAWILSADGDRLVKVQQNGEPGVSRPPEE